MKSKAAFRLCLALALATLCTLCVIPPAHCTDDTGDEDATEDAALTDVEGTVTRVGNFGFGLVPDSEPGTRYAPTEPLDKEFQYDGLRVRFSGIVGDPDESGGRGGWGGRRWGTPLEVTHIEALAESDGDEPGSGRS